MAEDLEHKPASPVDLFSRPVYAFARNMLRAARARLTHLSLAVAVPVLAKSYQESEEVRALPLPESMATGIGLVAKIRPSQYEDWSYVGDASCLVYLTTIFDTLLQDVIEFLLCLHPESMSHRQVALGSLFKAASRQDVVNDAIKAKVRELGFLNFEERFRWLRKQYGLRVELSDDARRQLALAADARNVVAHDQGWFEFRVAENGTVCLEQTGCPKRPTHVSPEDLDRAHDAFTAAAVALLESVYAHVLKCEVPEAVRGMLDVLRMEAAAPALAEQVLQPDSEYGSGTRRV